MRKTMAIGFISLGVTILPIVFTNCDVYSENNLFEDWPLTSCVETDDCIYENSELLELQINSENNLVIKSDIRKFDIGGDCNEGGYPNNVIIWELYLNNTRVASSNSTSLNGRCTNGRFAVEVNAPRDGLRDTSNVPQEHYLYVEVIGVDQNNKEFRNPLLARKSITLVPER